MSASRHTEAEIIAALKQVEGGRSAEDVGRELGVSKHTIYAWKAKYGGMEVSEAQEVKQLREENARLKKLVAAEPGQGHAAVGDPKKLAGLAVRRAEVRRLVAEFGASERHACELVEMARTTHRYCSRRDDSELRAQLVGLARERPRFGYRRIHVLLRREGVVVNHKKVQRVYRELGLSVKRTKRKRLSRLVRPRLVLGAPNEEWALDFVADVAASGQRLRVLAVVDSFTRECLALEVDTSLPSRRVTRVLEQIVEQRGLPQSIRCDNGPEMTSRHFLAWCIERKIDVAYIEPGKPTQNAYAESFNGRLREECLNVSWFWNLWDARRKIACWRGDYNHQRPHSALNYRTPEEFRQQWSASPCSIMGTAQIGPASRQPCGLAALDLDPGPTPQ